MKLLLFVCTFHPSRRYLLLKTHQLPLDAFLVSLKMMQVEDVDLDEVQCILANLIYMVSTLHARRIDTRWGRLTTTSAPLSGSH